MISLEAPETLWLPRAICSYGFFMMAPNRWDPAKEEFSRPLKVGTEVIDVVIRQNGGAGAPLQVVCEPTPETDAESKEVEEQIRRMLRMREDDERAIELFGRVCPDLLKQGLGRVFRSPSVWEDVVKQVTLCNAGWNRTLEMNEGLCGIGERGSFPSPDEILQLRVSDLQKRCKLGYRAARIHALAQAVERGDVALTSMEETARNVSTVEEAEEVRQSLLKVPGIGPYSSKNLLQLMGIFREIPCDSETVRHFKHAYGKKGVSESNIAKVADDLFREYAPVQFLAYWSRLWQEYEVAVGKVAHEMSHEDYKKLTGSQMRAALSGSSSIEQEEGRAKRRRTQ